MMRKALEQSIYKAFGLSIDSDIPLPELPVQKSEKKKIDIRIKVQDLSTLWNEIGVQGKFVLKENLVIFRIKNTGIFCVKGGNMILVSPMKGSAGFEKIRLYILGSCMGILLMQRKVLPLHGSTVAIDGYAYAFVGESGAGKSTLAQALIKKGCKLLSDDIVAISLLDNQTPQVIPSYPQQKLWQESLEKFGMETIRYSPLFDRETKYAVPIVSSFHAEPLPLKGIFELRKSENEEMDIYPIQGLQRLHMLFSHTYRHFLISRLGLLKWHFDISTTIVNQLDFFQIERPISTFTAHDLSSFILDSIKKEEAYHA